MQERQPRTDGGQRTVDGEVLEDSRRRAIMAIKNAEKFHYLVEFSLIMLFFKTGSKIGVVTGNS